MPRIFYPPDPNWLRNEIWSKRMAQTGFKPTSQFLGASETAKAPCLALRAKSIILNVAYRGARSIEYSYDSSAISSVVTGIEQISFWGQEDSITSLQKWISSGYDPTDDEISQLALGTTSVRSDHDRFGYHYALLCHTGSACCSFPALGPLLYDASSLINGLRGCVFSKLVALTRNCSGSGTAIQRFQERELRSTFFGFYPFGVIDGKVEIGEYRESYREVADMLSAMRHLSNIYCASQKSRAFVEALLDMHLSPFLSLPSVVVTDGASTERLTGWNLETELDYGMSKCYIVPSADGEFASLAQIAKPERLHETACTVLSLPLEDPSWVKFQCQAEALGFRLTAIIPSIISNRVEEFTNSTYLENQRSQVMGIWSLPNPTYPIAPPFYLDDEGNGSAEKNILNYLRDCIGAWQNAVERGELFI